MGLYEVCVFYYACSWGQSVRIRGARDEKWSIGWFEGTVRLMGLAERYFEALKDAKVRGYLFEQQNYVPKPE